MPTTFVSNSNEQLTVSISEKLIKSVFFVEDPVAEQHLPAASCRRILRTHARRFISVCRACALARRVN